MPEIPTNQVGETMENVAFNLMLNVAAVEQKGFKVVAGVPFVTGDANRQWLLDTYAECLEAVRGHRVRPKAPRPGNDRYRGADEE